MCCSIYFSVSSRSLSASSIRIWAPRYPPAICHEAVHNGVYVVEITPWIAAITWLQPVCRQDSKPIYQGQPVKFNRRSISAFFFFQHTCQRLSIALTSMPPHLHSDQNVLDDVVKNQTRSNDNTESNTGTTFASHQLVERCSFMRPCVMLTFSLFFQTFEETFPSLTVFLTAMKSWCQRQCQAKKNHLIPQSGSVRHLKFHRSYWRP